jgi:hypothetical protein
MLKEKENQNNLLQFLGVTALCLAVGLGVGYATDLVYKNYLADIDLVFGETILILGLMACSVYSLIGLAIALAYQKYMK